MRPAELQRIDEIEKAQRHRALTDRESIELEVLIAARDGTRISHGTSREAARHGLKRLMSRYQSGRMKR